MKETTVFGHVLIWFVFCLLQVDLQLTITPNPQAYGATGVTSILLTDSSFNVDWTINSESIFRLTHTSTSTSPIDLTSSYSSRVMHNQTTDASGITAIVSISGLGAAELGRAIIVQAFGGGMVGSVNFNIQECPESTVLGVITQRSESPCGLGCVGHFTCGDGYISASRNATCQEDATFSSDALNLCREDPVCNNSEIPINESYLRPPAGTTTYPNSLPLTCAENYDGSPLAKCLINRTWNVSNNCNEACNQSNIPEDVSLANTLVGVSLVGQSVTVPCNIGYTGTAIATCIALGQWNVTLCSALCMVSESGTASETYCSTTTSPLTIIEGSSSDVHCCVNPSTTAPATCTHMRELNVTLDCSESTTQTETVLTQTTLPATTGTTDQGGVLFTSKVTSTDSGVSAGSTDSSTSTISTGSRGGKTGGSVIGSILGVALVMLITCDCGGCVTCTIFEWAETSLCQCYSSSHYLCCTTDAFRCVVEDNKTKDHGGPNKSNFVLLRNLLKK
uniref:E-selectin-like n=1 Tax=Phallusia mammillata TaxID=59560 RepID=A0A6F9DSU4_9ASCI|nr:E-selectin-like [Phallusia mammillata]